MIRRAALGLVLLLLVVPSSCLAQAAVEDYTGEDAAPTWDLPDFSSRNVSGESVADLADFIGGCIGETGSLPDFAQVQTTDGRLRRISLAHVFVLLARTAYLWQATGQLPATVPIAPDEVAPPVLDAEDYPVGRSEDESGREIPTDQFLAQCAASVRWIDRLQVIPTAVWVDGERLSAAEYLAGLAVCIQYAYWEGGLYDYLYLGGYSPPPSWMAEVAPEPATTPSPAETEWETDEPVYEEAEWTAETEEYEESYWQEESTEGGSQITPWFAPSFEARPSEIPRLTLYPEPGATVSGVVDLVAAYTGPPARFVTFDIAGRSEVIMNYPPYSCRWDTSDLVPGTHTVRVQVLADTEFVLVDQVSAFEVVPPAPAETAESVEGAF